MGGQSDTYHLKVPTRAQVSGCPKEIKMKVNYQTTDPKMTGASCTKATCTRSRFPEGCVKSDDLTMNAGGSSGYTKITTQYETPACLKGETTPVVVTTEWDSMTVNGVGSADVDIAAGILQTKKWTAGDARLLDYALHFNNKRTSCTSAARKLGVCADIVDAMDRETRAHYMNVDLSLGEGEVDFSTILVESEVHDEDD